MAESPDLLVQPAGPVMRRNAWRVVAATVLAVGVACALTVTSFADTPAPAPAAKNPKPVAKPAVVAKPVPAVVAKANPAAKPAPVVAKANPAVAKATPVVAKATPVAKPTPVVAKTVPVAKAAPVVAKAAPVAHAVAPRPNAPAAPARVGSTVHAASLAGSSAPVVTAVPQNAAAAAPNAAHLDDHVTYQYNALGRRDPFQSLVEGAFVGVDVGGDAPPDPGGIKVVGIVWGATDQFALVEDARGNSFVLRKGDKVQNGVVEGLKRDGVIVNITAEGQSQSVVIPLTRKGDSNAR